MGEIEFLGHCISNKTSFPVIIIAIVMVITTNNIITIIMSTPLIMIIGDRDNADDVYD